MEFFSSYVKLAFICREFLSLGLRVIQQMKATHHCQQILLKVEIIKELLESVVMFIMESTLREIALF